MVTSLHRKNPWHRGNGSRCGLGFGIWKPHPCLCDPWPWYHGFTHTHDIPYMYPRAYLGPPRSWETPPTEVFIMPLWFLPESGHSCGILWIPAELFLAEPPAKITIPGTIYSGGIEPFWNWDRMVLEWTGMESGGMHFACIINNQCTPHLGCFCPIGVSTGH